MPPPARSAGRVAAVTIGLEKLECLAKPRDRGLDEAEFQREKSALLGS